MEFYTVNEQPRPARTSEVTRAFAKKSLEGFYGREAETTMAVTLDHIENFMSLSAYDMYDAAVKEIAEKSPIRLREDELLAGSATLGMAMRHVTPATYNGNHVLGSVSHLTAEFHDVVDYGMEYREKKIDEKLASPDLDEKQLRVLTSMKRTTEAMRIWHGRYLGALEDAIAAASGSDKARLVEIYENLLVVPFKPAKNFYQAVQSVWFSFAFLRLLGNWPGLGRLDVIFGRFIEKDLGDAIIDTYKAREILAHFFIKGCEWVKLGFYGSGDAQHYQNIVLGGIDGSGREITNESTYLMLEVLEEFPISDYPIAVRINPNTPERLHRLIADVIMHGGGVVAVYNEPLILKSLTGFGYAYADAVRFANDGCWEVQIPGETCFSYHPFDGYKMLQEDVYQLNKGDTPVYNSFEQIYSKYIDTLKIFFAGYNERTNFLHAGNNPTTCIDIFVRGCIEKGRSYYDLGPNYAVISPHLGGFADVVNSMYAVKKIVFDEKKLTLGEFLDILRSNWGEHEHLRLAVRNNYKYFGNDSDEVDGIAVRLLNDYMDIIRALPKTNGVIYPPGISTFGRQIEWRDMRYSHAHGFKSGEILASNLSPTPDTDLEGATAVIKSHCKLDLERLTCGTALDIKLQPSMVAGDELAKKAVIPLVKGFVNLGGYFMQIDVLDNKVLLEAQKHPENYQNLSVRLSGWSARFVTLDKNWQEMIINRTTQKRQ